MIYVTGNSASGSKYYDLTGPGRKEFGPDLLNPNSHYANWSRTRSTSAPGRRASRCATTSSWSRTSAPARARPQRGGRARQRSWCGPNSGATAAQPVGSWSSTRSRSTRPKANTDGQVGGSVPATLWLTLGTAPDVRRVHAGHREGVHRQDRRHRDLHGRRRDADGVRPGPPSPTARSPSRSRSRSRSPSRRGPLRSPTTRWTSRSSSSSRRAMPCAPAPTRSR